MQLNWQEVNEQLMVACRRLATQGLRGPIARELTAGDPVIALAIDTDRDVAAAALLSWSERDSGWQPDLYLATLERHDGEWVHCGQAGGPPPADYPLAHRRSCPEGHIRLYHGPDVGHGLEPRRRPAWLSAAMLVSAEVDSVRVGERILEVPFHGYLAIAVRDPANAMITAFGDSSQLQTLDLRRGSADLYREQRRRDPQAWPFQISQPEP